MTINLGLIGLEGKEKIVTITSTSPVSCNENDKIEKVIHKIITTGYRRIPIVSNRGQVVGILTKSDILNAFLRGEKFDDKISKIMVRDVIKCDENDSIQYVLDKFKISRRGGFPVVRGDKLIGVISERDLIKKIADVDTGKKVAESMTKKPFFIRPDISILDCLRAVVNTRYRRLPVVDNGKLVGIVTAADLLSYIHANDYKIEALDDGVDKIMIKGIITINKDTDLSEAVKKMSSNEIGNLMVVDEDNNLEGIITERDILEEIEYE